MVLDHLLQTPSDSEGDPAESSWFLRQLENCTVRQRVWKEQEYSTGDAYGRLDSGGEGPGRGLLG